MISFATVKLMSRVSAMFMCVSHSPNAAAVLMISIVTVKLMSRVLAMVMCVSRKNDFIHHNPEGLVYRSFCLNSSTFAVSETASRRWWCIEYLFPVSHSFLRTLLYYIILYNTI